MRSIVYWRINRDLYGSVAMQEFFGTTEFHTNNFHLPIFEHVQQQVLSRHPEEPFMDTILRINYSE